jgi:hypothetical protein
MRATKLISELQGRSLGVSLGREIFDGYEQRLIQWGCPQCRFFEMRHFMSGVPSNKELDAYIICRFAGELVDLLGEVATCPKNCRPELPKTESISGWRTLHCVHRA